MNQTFKRFTIIALLISLTLNIQVHILAYQNPSGGNATSSPVCYSHWQSIGPFHVAQTYPGINDPTDPEDIGSASDIWLTGSTAYLASVNGGVWRTNISGTEAYGGPHWEALTDHMPCTSISAISGSKDDPDIIVAGCGFPSNSGRGSEPLGVMISKDGGDSWSMTNFPKGYFIGDIIISGTGSTARIVVSAKAGIHYPTDNPDPYVIGYSIGGIWWSSDSGNTFVQSYSLFEVNATAITGVNQLLQHPFMSNIIFATILTPQQQTTHQFTNASILISTDSGLTWTLSSQNPLNRVQCLSSTKILNAQITMSPEGTLYAGFYTDGDCYAFYESSDNGANFLPILGAPQPPGNFSLGSGATNFAMFSPPSQGDTLFVSGSLGRVFRVQNRVWTLISSVPGPADPTAPTQATASFTAPHAGSRTFAWTNETGGELFLTSDGGVYRRTNPLLSPDQGDWFSLTGDLVITEVNQLSGDPVTGAMILAAQDNSLMISQFDGTEAQTGIWNFLFRGTGVATGLDTRTSPASFYGVGQSLSHLFKVPILGNHLSAGVNSVIQPFSIPLSTQCSPGDPTCLRHRTHIAVNSVDSSQLLICSSGIFYEFNSACYKVTFSSTSQVSTPLEFSSWTYAWAFELYDFFDVYVFGGMKNGVANPDVIFAVGYNTWSRDVPCSTPECVTIMQTADITGNTYGLNECSSTSYPGAAPCNLHNFYNWWTPWYIMPMQSVAQHPSDYYINVVVDAVGHIFLTNDFGVNFYSLNDPANSNLLAISGHTTVDTFWTEGVSFLPIIVGGVHPLLVGLGSGIFVTFTNPAVRSPNTGSPHFTFQRLGANLPNTVATSFVYFAATDTLYVSLFGRGIWQLESATQVLTEAYHGVDTSLINNGCLTPLYPNVPNAYGYIESGVLPQPIGFGPKQILVTGIPTSINLNETFQVSIVLSTAPPTGIWTIQPTLSSLGVIAPTTISFTALNWTQPQVVSIQVIGVYGGTVLLLTNLLGEFVKTGFAPASIPLTVLGPPSPFISSSSSSAGHFSSSDTGYHSSSSSTGGLGPSGSTGDSSSSISGGAFSASSSSTGSSSSTAIPALLPSFELLFRLTSTTVPGGSLLAFRAVLINDLAKVCNVDPNRILILSILDTITTNSLLVTFTITPRLSVSSLEGDLDTTVAGQQFLTETASSSSTFFTLPIGQYAVVGSGFLTLPPSTAVHDLQQVSFGLNYDVNNLPGGNTIMSFSSLILRDISAACSVQVPTPNSRLFMLGLTAGSIQAAFTVSPNITTNEATDQQIIDAFLAAASNSSSLLYSGSTTSATITGSTTVGTPGSTTTTSTDEDTGLSKSRLAGVLVGVLVAFLLFALTFVIFWRLKRAKARFAHHDQIALEPIDPEVAGSEPSVSRLEGQTTRVGPSHSSEIDMLPLQSRQLSSDHDEIDDTSSHDQRELSEISVQMNDHSYASIYHDPSAATSSDTISAPPRDISDTAPILASAPRSHHSQLSPTTGRRGRPAPIPQ